jgi:hypothetical protein
MTGSGWRNTRSVVVLLALAAAFVLVQAGTAFAGAAVDEYSLNLPDAKGKVESPEAAPTANVRDLGPVLGGMLARDPNGKALATIATAGSLGAPGGSATGLGADRAAVAGSQPSALTAAASAVGDPGALALLIVLALLGGVLLFRKTRSRTGSA